MPQLFATDTETSVVGLKTLLQLCFAEEPPELFSRSVDNEDLLQRIQKPVLITRGADDAIVNTEAVDRTRATPRFGTTRMHSTGACTSSANVATQLEHR